MKVLFLIAILAIASADFVLPTPQELEELEGQSAYLSGEPAPVRTVTWSSDLPAVQQQQEAAPTQEEEGRMLQVLRARHAMREQRRLAEQARQRFEQERREAALQLEQERREAALQLEQEREEAFAHQQMEQPRQQQNRFPTLAMEDIKRAQRNFDQMAPFGTAVPQNDQDLVNARIRIQTAPMPAPEQGESPQEYQRRCGIVKLRRMEDLTVITEEARRRAEIRSGLVAQRGWQQAENIEFAREDPLEAEIQEHVAQIRQQDMRALQERREALERARAQERFHLRAGAARLLKQARAIADGTAPQPEEPVGSIGRMIQDMKKHVASLEKKIGAAHRTLNAY